MDTTSWVDWARGACLCHEGMPGWAAAVCISADGREDMVLLDQALIGDTRYGYDATCADVPHEQTGQLPARWRSRVALAPLRCNRPTKAGGRCRAYVTQPGAACGWHRTRTAPLPSQDDVAPKEHP